MRKNLIAGAAILALLMNAPQVKADEIVVFGSEFEDEISAPKKVEKPEPVKELPPPQEEPTPIEQPAPPEEKPEVIEPQPPTQPVEQPAEPESPANEQPAQIAPQDVSITLPEDEDDIGDTLIFDDLTKTPEQKPVEQPQEPPIINEPAQIEQPVEPSLPSEEIERPFGQPSRIASEEPAIIVPPTPEFTPPQSTPVKPIKEQTQIQEQTPVRERSARQNSTPRATQPQKNLKTLQPRFVKLAVDDTYIYYLDKNSVQWKKMPYSTSEYIADVWVRMIEREPRQLDDDMATYGADNFNAEISLAREQGYQYASEDLQVLRNQAYVLEHYYLRPKTKQIQFLCELEVFGRPQNTVSERAYDYRNWENLVPGSVESVIYEATIKIIGTWKSTERGHMTFSDMLDEYLRIAL